MVGWLERGDEKGAQSLSISTHPHHSAFKKTAVLLRIIVRVMRMFILARGLYTLTSRVAYLFLNTYMCVCVD